MLRIASKPKNYTIIIGKNSNRYSIFIYQYLMNVRHNNQLLKTVKEKITSHISGIFYKTVNYLTLGIEPIYIFDGKPPEDK